MRSIDTPIDAPDVDREKFAAKLGSRAVLRTQTEQGFLKAAAGPDR